MKKELRLTKALTLAALLMLALLITVTSTFSWYPRTSSTTSATLKLNYERTDQVSGIGTKTVKTYLGTQSNGHVTYAATELAANSAVPVNNDKIYYFKTVITDTSSVGDSVISLYLDKITASVSSIQIGLTSPEKTYKTATLTGGSVSNYCLEDNIIISSQGSVEIYWFIKYTGSLSFTLGNFYYVNN